MKKSIIPMLTPLLLMNVNFGCEGRIPSNNCFYVDDPVGCDKIYFLLFFVKQKFFYAMWTGVTASLFTGGKTVQIRFRLYF